jgi:DNA polymerase I-like protein with 3'-5' exonuclease and polymerase domains
MQPNKYVYLDSEFNQTNEQRLNVLCFALVSDKGTDKYWLQNGKDIESFKDTIADYLIQNYTFVSFNVESEASALISLGINPLQMKWVDLYLEYVMLSNHNNDISKGNQYVRGSVKRISSFSGDKGPKNLSAALYKLCNIKIDSDHKNKMRDLIISNPASFSDEEKTAIMDYCLSDTIHLSKLLTAVKQKYKQTIPSNHLKTLGSEVHWRAEYAIRTAMMVRHGYPVNVEWVKNLTDNIPAVMRNLIEDINEQFPEIKPFKFNKSSSKYSLDTKAVRAWIETSGNKGWERTETGLLSLALDAFKKFYNYSHDYPTGNFGAQMVRYFNMAQQLKGFSEPSGVKNNTFWDYVGSDGMVRPYMNIYGAQSSRTQPSSTSMLFLKTGWVRSLCVAPKGYAVGAIDYSSQEFLLGGLEANDQKMIDAYASGDVYLAYGKEIGVIPKEGTKSSHGKQRDAQKPVILGWQYWSTGFGLSITLNEQLGKLEYTPESAQLLLDKLDSVYSKFAEFRNRTIEEYKVRKYVRLRDGFYMHGNNPNPRSVGNMPVQGMGAAIMRKAVQLAQDAGLNVIFTLHDALYIMFDSNDITAMDTLRRCMKEAFVFYYEGDLKEKASMIRMDGKAWSLDFEDGGITTKDNFKIEVQKIFVDKRSKKQYDSFSKYFTTELNLNLL